MILMPKKAKTKPGEIDPAIEGELIAANGSRRGAHAKKNGTKGRGFGHSKADRIVHTILGYKYEGDLPHEFLLRVVRGEMIEHGQNEDGTPAYVVPTFAQRLICAKEA